MLMNTGDEVVHSKNGLLSTIGIAENGKISYALEGSIFHAGSTIQWLRDKLGIIADAGETAAIARSLSSNNGCYLVPAFSGLGAPWWDPDSRGLICGLTAGSDRATLVRAACESMAYQTYDVLRSMEADAGRRLSGLSVDGAASRNEFIIQSKRTCWESPSFSPSIETTALGAAYLAGLAVGYWEDRDELVQNRNLGKCFEPAGNPVELARHYQVGMMLWRGPVPCYSETRVANRAP